MADFLSQLFECSFGGVSFPVESLSVDVNQDVVQHRRMDRNGARLENTGLGPVSYSIRAPFFSDISRGQNETWDNLYPDQKDKLLERLADRSTQFFVHPEFGQRNCKCLSFKSALSPEQRNGVYLDFVLLEDSGDDDAVVITENSINSLISESALSLDSALGNLNPPIDTGLADIGFDSFTDAVNKITKVFDQIGLVQKQQLGKIDAVIGKINRLTFSVTDPIATFSSAQDQLIAGLLQFRSQVLTTAQPVGFYETLARTTLGSLSITLRNSTKDLITLNPELVRQPTIPAFTVVRFYKV